MNLGLEIRGEKWRTPLERYVGSLAEHASATKEPLPQAGVAGNGGREKKLGEREREWALAGSVNHPPISPLCIIDRTALTALDKAQRATPRGERVYMPQTGPLQEERRREKKKKKSEEVRERGTVEQQKVNDDTR